MTPFRMTKSILYTVLHAALLLIQTPARADDPAPGAQSDCQKVYRAAVITYYSIESAKEMSAEQREAADKLLSEACAPKYSHCRFSICSSGNPGAAKPERGGGERKTARAAIELKLSDRRKELQRLAAEEKTQGIEWRPFTAE